MIRIRKNNCILVYVFILISEVVVSQSKEKKKLTWKEYERMEFEKLCKLPDSEDILIWNENYKLQPEDFWEKKSMKDKACAYVQLGCLRIHVAGGRSIIKIYACIDRKRSWISNSISKEDLPYVLNHEQRHFDLAEVCARKIRERVIKKFRFKIRLKWKDLNWIEKLYEEYQKLQEKYDSETDLSKESQEKWNKWIDEELEKTKKWYNKHLVIVKRCRCR